MVEKKRKKVTNWEIFWIVVASLIGAAGLFLIVLGFVGDYWEIEYSLNWIQQSENSLVAAIGLSYRGLGAILVVACGLLSALFLHIFAKKADAYQEREARRKMRLEVMSESLAEEPKVEAAPTETKPEAK